MECTIALLQYGKTTTKPLIKGWGNKYALSWKNDDGTRYRAVVDINDKKIDGFVKLGKQTIGLPSQKLKQVNGALLAEWPPLANGLIVHVIIKNAEEISTQSLKQTITKQVRQFWGVFKNAAGCECKVIGPKDTKPSPPAGFRLFEQHKTSQAAADRGLEKCIKYYPVKNKRHISGAYLLS